MNLKPRPAVRLAFCVVVALVAVLSGFTAGNRGLARAGGVTIGDGATDGSDTFTPNVVTISVGDSVTFTWVDGTHDARDAQSGAIYLPLSTDSNSKTTTFSTAGTYYFYCSVHAKAADATDANIASNAKQVGKIIVLPAAAATSVPTAAPTTAPPPAAQTTPAPTSAAAPPPSAASPVGQAATPAPATPGAATSPSSSATAVAPAPSVSSTAVRAPFEAAISVSTAPAAPATGSGLNEEAPADPLPRWLEAVAVFGVIATVALIIMIRTMRRA